MPRPMPQGLILFVMATLLPLLAAGSRSARGEPPKVSKRAAEFGVVVEKNVWIAMRDGIRLAADIYRPARDGKPADGRFPTLLTRTPYDKNGVKARGATTPSAATSSSPTTSGADTPARGPGG